MHVTSTSALNWSFGHTVEQQHKGVFSERSVKESARKTLQTGTMGLDFPHWQTNSFRPRYPIIGTPHYGPPDGQVPCLLLKIIKQKPPSSPYFTIGSFRKSLTGAFETRVPSWSLLWHCARPCWLFNIWNAENESLLDCTVQGRSIWDRRETWSDFVCSGKTANARDFKAPDAWL